jgi:hypothetical protein
MFKNPQSVEAYINKIYQGDRSKVEIVSLDYAFITSESDLVKWTERTFGLTCRSEADGQVQSSRAKIVNLFKSMGKCVEHNVLVVERNCGKKPTDLVSFIKEMKTMMSFHFSREFRHRIDFVEE